MNPLIEKFWNTAGYKISKVLSEPFPLTKFSEREYLWYLTKDGVYINTIGMSEVFIGFKESSFKNNIKCYYYYFNKQMYSEEGMLKIIQMKAFL